MGVCLAGIIVLGEIELAKEIVHFRRDGNTLIFLDESYWSILAFSTICAAGLLAKADFSEDEHIEELIELLLSHTFIVFYYSEWADLTDQEYGVVFENGVYQKRTENIYDEFLKLGLSFDFMFDHSYWNFEHAKRTYLNNNTLNNGLYNG